MPFWFMVVADAAPELKAVKITVLKIKACSSRSVGDLTLCSEGKVMGIGLLVHPGPSYSRMFLLTS